MARSNDLLLACPECDSSSVKRNVVTDLQGPKVDVSKYACEDCGNRFGEYDAVYRERKMESRPRKDSVARELLDAHPDDLATDGGSIQPDETETGARSEDDTDRFEELAVSWENEAHYLNERGHEEVAGVIEACASELRHALDTETDRTRGDR